MLKMRYLCNMTLQNAWHLFSTKHTWGKGRSPAGTVTGDLMAAIKGKIAPGDHYKVALAMKTVYKKHGLDDLWAVARQTLISKGVTNLPPLL